LAIAAQKISDFEVATMLISEQELVMGKPQKKHDPPQEQEQSQAQANLQGQLQGQGQGQAQPAVQSLKSNSNDATLTQDAFTQTITQGANIQFNSMTMEVAGNNLTDDYHTL
jgi:hypothetical protein